MGQIYIYRDFPIINGYVQVPPNREGKIAYPSNTTVVKDDKARVTTAEAQSALTGESVKRLESGSGQQTGWNHGQQEWLRLAGLLQVGASGYADHAVDPVTTLASS
jgi:hypothetical protein|tara:strand:+ start:777 stop:1094 length:318 start_codon:yes stop_codon:yes gene_type:complete